ncbi:MAG: hypothetical protein HY244_00395 [Rhizobiales bacterium]|nr:hypothetical protein [Hyphomicrobiales bacterium]
MSAIAFIGAAASLSQLAAATAAATGGFLLWNWPQQRYPFAMTALFGAATALFAVATTIVLFTRANPLAMAVLLGLFIAGAAHKRLPLAERPVGGPIMFGIIVLIPVLLAVAVSFFTAPSTDY